MEACRAFVDWLDWVSCRVGVTVNSSSCVAQLIVSRVSVSTVQAAELCCLWEAIEAAAAGIWQRRSMSGIRCHVAASDAGGGCHTFITGSTSGRLSTLM